MISVPFSSLAPRDNIIEVPCQSAARAHCPALIIIIRGTSYYVEESLDNAVLATRLLIRGDFPVSYMFSLLHCTQ